MIKRTIAYIDLNNKPRTEDFYFHFNEVELMEMQLKYRDGIDETVKRLSEEKDNEKIWYLFKDVILSAYGEKTADGRSHKKNQDMREFFEGCPALSQLIVELMSDEADAARFMRGLLPPERMAAAKAKAEATQKNDGPTEVPTAPPVLENEPAPDVDPAWIREDREPTDVELRSMTKDQMAEAYQRKMLRGS